MTKEEYLSIKSTNPLQVIYEYYKEKFDSSKHKPFLSPQEFVAYFQLYINVNKVYDRVCEYYNNKFTVIELRDKHGNFISFL